MDNKPQTIGFTLNNITNEQFATFDEAHNEKGKIRLGTEISYGADNEKKLISVFTGFVFESDEKPFIKIEIGCHYEILNEAWSDMYNSEKNLLAVPKGFIRHLAVIAVGTTRGVLFAKTENTCYSKYLLPTINLTELIKDDVIFNFQEKK